MSTPPRPKLKSLPPTTGQPHAAALPAVRTAGGPPKVVGRKAVPSAVRPDPQETEERSTA